MLHWHVNYGQHKPHNSLLMGKHFPWSGTAHPTSARYLPPSQTSHTKQPCSLPTPVLLNFSFESLSQTQSIHGQPQVTMVECPRDCGAWRHIWGYGVPLPPYSNRKTRSFFSELFPWRALGVSTYQQNSTIKPRNTLYQLWVWWLVLSWTSFQKLQDWGCSHIPSWHIDINSENESFTESQENPYRNKWKMMSNSNKAADTNQLFFSLTYLKAALLV